MSTELMDIEMDETADQGKASGVFARTGASLGAGRLWFRAFRRSRPFWGAIWLGLGGAAVIHFSRAPLTMVVGGGWNASAGYILGGAMVMFALVALLAPLYRGLCGLVGVLLGLAAFIAANLGGYLIGSLLAIIGGSMIWGWGEKKQRKQRGERRADDDREQQAAKDAS